MLPPYLAKAVPNPMRNRAPWYANTAPTYAGIFLWIAFYQRRGGGRRQHAGRGLGARPLRQGEVTRSVLCCRLQPMPGISTGFPRYFGGSSPSGTAGGYI